MDWVLFFQIEVMMLTVGLVIVFILQIRQNGKDESWFRKVNAVGDALKEYGKSQTENRDASVRAMTDLAKAITKMKKGE